MVASRLIKREKDSLPLTCVAQKRPFLRTVLTIVTAHIFCACQGSRVRRERNTQHAGQQQTYKENLLCYHLLLILKPCYNYHCICASSRVHCEIWGKNNFLSFSNKCPFSVFLHIEAQLSLKNAWLPPVFFLDFSSP